MLDDMKTISLSVSEEVYEAFRHLSQREGRSIAQTIRDAMSLYLTSHGAPRRRLEDIRVLAGVRQIAPLPTREEIWDEITDRHFRTDGD
jgi:hypothetical protein